VARKKKGSCTKISEYTSALNQVGSPIICGQRGRPGARRQRSEAGRQHLQQTCAPPVACATVCQPLDA
jgi:hypothetical protein